MIRISLSTVALLFLILGAGCARPSLPSTEQRPSPSSTSSLSALAPIIPSDGVFTVMSPALSRGTIPNRYTHDGQNAHPPLSITNIPKETAALAILMTDSDANGALHWSAWNIPSSTRFIQESSLPDGSVEGKNDFERTGYDGPEPPRGETHHYVLTVFALRAPLTLASATAKQEVLQTIQQNTITQTSLQATYAKE